VSWSMTWGYRKTVGMHEKGMGYVDTKRTFESLEDKMTWYFKDLIVDKKQSLAFFNTLSLPSFVRDWFINKYSDDHGKINVSFMQAKISEIIPGKDNWPMHTQRIMSSKESIRVVARITVKADLVRNQYTFEMVDLGVSHRETLILPNVIKKHKDTLLSGQNDVWGVLTLSYRNVGSEKSPYHRILLDDYVDFKPYTIDLDFYTRVRSHFTCEEWIDVLLTAIDYNPSGFSSVDEKRMLLRRLLPFVEKRLNVIEFAPKGTGKSYVFSQISKYGWLNSGGLVTRAKLFYNMATKTEGLIAHYDYVCLDEISNTRFAQLPEIQASLKGYLENGKYSVGNKYGTSDAGLVVLGNIDADFMDSKTYFMNNMMTSENQQFFNESALLDRFHGFIEGWKIGRMTENKKVKGIGLNSEYFSEIMHHMRDDIRYDVLFDQLVEIPLDSDTRDTHAIKKLTVAHMKLFFPHWKTVDQVDDIRFKEDCLKPAIEMRRIIKTQLSFMDSEFEGIQVPNITLKTRDSENQ
jgi:ATP-dependent Lon protease